MVYPVSAQAYVVIACILLVNLLVALFGATFSKISEAADLQYHLERARIILSFEQARLGVLQSCRFSLPRRSLRRL